MWGCSAFSFTGVHLWTDRSCERSRNRKNSQPRWNICHVVSTASDSWRDLVQRLRYATLTSAGVIGVIHCACVPRYRSWRALPRSSLYGGFVIGVVSGSFEGGGLVPKPLTMDNIFSKRNQHYDTYFIVYTVIHNHLQIYYFHYPSGMLEDWIHWFEMCLLRSPAGCSHTHQGLTVKIRKANVPMP